MTAALHFLLGFGSRCFEEEHDEQIRDLQERVHIQAKIIVKYIEKYGQLRTRGQLCRHPVQYHLLTPVTKPKSEPISPLHKMLPLR